MRSLAGTFLLYFIKEFADFIKKLNYQSKNSHYRHHYGDRSEDVLYNIAHIKALRF